MTEREETQLYLSFMEGIYQKIKPIGYPFIRFFFGLVLIPHGMQKLFSVWGGSIEGTAGFISKLGYEPAVPLAYLVGGVEFFGGILIAIGLFTRVAAAALAVELVLIMFIVKMPHGFFAYKGGYEYEMLLALLAIGFFCAGGGNMSVDRKIGREF